MKLGANLRKIRKKWGYQQEEFAKIFDVKRSVYGKYELGRTQPSIALVIQLQDMTQINVRDLVYRDLKEEEIPEQPILNTTFKTDLDKDSIVNYITENDVKNFDQLVKKIAEMDEMVQKMKQAIGDRKRE